MMPRSIFRYRLAITDEPSVFMPIGAEVLSVGPPRDGRDLIDLWAVVHLLPDGGTVPEEERAFRVVGTGNPLPTDAARFVGTVPVYDGRLIFHVFEAA